MGEAKRRREINLENALPNHILPEDVPVLIRKTAEEICGAYYDGPRSATFRARWLDQYVYVKLNWASFVPDAKEALAAMLTMPETEVPLDVKDMIMDVFVTQAEDRRMTVPASALN